MASVDNVQDIEPLDQYTASGGQTAFPYTFPIFEDDNLVVYDNDALMALGSDYTVSGEGDDNGGTVTFLVGRTAGHIITIYRDVPIERDTDFSQNGPRRSADMNDELDRITMWMQQLERDIGRKIGLSLRNAQPSSELALDPIAAWEDRYLFINADGELEPAAAVALTTLTSSIIRALLLDSGYRYVIHPFETASGLISAALTFGFDVGDVRRYGALGNFVANDAPAFNRAIKVAKENGGTVIVPLPSVAYLLEDPLDCTTDNVASGAPIRGWTLRCEANVLAVTTNSPYFPSIIARHTGHVFDLSGSFGVNFENLNVGTDVTTFPKTCFFLARNSDGSSQIHRITNCRVLGLFSEAIAYNYGSEDDIWTNCQLFNEHTGSSNVMTVTQTNIRSLSSTFITIATGAQSTITHLIQGGSFSHNSTNAAADVFYFQNSNHVRVRDVWINGRGRSFVYIDTSGGATDMCSLSGISGENSSPLPTYGVRFAGGAATCVGWSIKDCYLPSTTRAISMNTGVALVMDSFYISNINEPTSKGIQVLTAQGCTIDVLCPIVLTNSNYNLLTGQIDNWTITTRTNDEWIDKRITKTWAANTSALTITGGLVVNRGKSEYQLGRLVVTLVLVAGTSIVCAAGTAITGLPRNASDFSADLRVVNLTTGAEISGGYVSGGNLVMPAINVTTDPICITASYFVNGA